MITNIYKNTTNKSDSDELCVDITEIIYNLLNPIYNFNRVIQVKQIKDIAKITDKTAIREAIYINIAEYTGSARTVLKRLNTEAFININKILVIVIPSNLLKFVNCNCMNLEIEYIPKTLTLVDTEIEVEDNLCIVTFNPKEVI